MTAATRILWKSWRIHNRMKWHGMDVSIETPAGDTRHWHDEHTGQSGCTHMQWSYGYLRKTGAHDGDHVDVYIGPFPDTATHVYVVRQMKGPHFVHYDEDKCMIGFNSREEAEAAYRAHYDKPGFLGWIDEYPVDAFIAAVAGTHKAPQPVGGYETVNGFLGDQDLNKSQNGFDVGTVRDWHGIQYKKIAGGDWRRVSGDPNVHADILFNGHKIEGKHGHELHTLPGTHGLAIKKVLDEKPVGTSMRIGHLNEQVTYRKDKDGWHESEKPGAPFEPISEDELIKTVIAARNVHATPVVVSEHASRDVPEDLLSPDPALPPREQAIRRAEATIIGHAHERGLLFDSSGKILLHREGTRGKIQFSDAEIAKFENGIMTHNHPGDGCSLSPSDLAAAMSANLHEIRAVAHNSEKHGSKSYIHRIVRPDAGWESTRNHLAHVMSGGDPKVMASLLASAPTALMAKSICHELCKADVNSLGINDPDPVHVANVLMSKTFGWRYYRNEVK